MPVFRHRFDQTVLREYDIRGIVGKTLNPEDAFAIGRCFGSVVMRADGKRVAVYLDGERNPDLAGETESVAAQPGGRQRAVERALAKRKLLDRTPADAGRGGDEAAGRRAVGALAGAPMVERGFQLGCVTNKSARFAEVLLEPLDLRRYFPVLVAGDTLPVKKPDPAPLLHAAKLIGVEPGAMVMIGDSANDAVAARRAGCPVICVSYGYREGADLRSIHADAIVDSLTEVDRLVQGP
jgi:hypothetical protein